MYENHFVRLEGEIQRNHILMMVMIVSPLIKLYHSRLRLIAVPYDAIQTSMDVLLKSHDR